MSLNLPSIISPASHQPHHIFLQFLPRFIARRHFFRIRYRQIHQILPDSHISHDLGDSPRKIQFISRPGPGRRGRNTAVGTQSLDESFHDQPGNSLRRDQTFRIQDMARRLALDSLNGSFDVDVSTVWLREEDKIPRGSERNVTDGNIPVARYKA